MKTISEELTKAIQQVLGGFFNDMAQELLGIVPRLDKQKRIVFTTKPQGLVSLFLKGLGDKKVLKEEKEALNVMLRISSGYVNALRDRTESTILNSLNSYLTEDKALKASKIKTIVNKEMDKAKKHFELISNAESNKSVNLGTALQITRMAEAKKEEDPTVFFVVTVDEKTGPYEFILHLLPDRKTPRLWKLSEVISDYYKPGGQYPSLCGLHVRCRCKITYLANGYGFDEKGNVRFISLDHDEFTLQRKKYGLPKVPDKISKRKGEWVLPDMEKTEDLAKAEWWKNPEINPKVPHIANNGQEVWKYKYIPYGGKLHTPEQMDKHHRTAWKTYSKKIPKGSPLRNTMVNLNKDIINDNDRHLRISGVHNHPDGKNHTEMRQRHLLNLYAGKKGYSMEEVKHPETGEHQGVRIKAPRHHKDGNLGETSWFYDGKSLKTEHNDILPIKY